MQSLLHPFVVQGRVTLNTSCACRNGGFQTVAYAQNARAYSSLSMWWAYLDVDEYIVLRDHNTSILLALRRLSARIGAIPHAVALPWRLFGTSGHHRIPADSVLASYTRRARARTVDWRTQSYKSIVSSACSKPTVHNCAGYTFATPTQVQQYTMEGQTFRYGVSTIPQSVQCDISGRPRCIAWINHYKTKSLEEWWLKRARGRADHNDQSPGLDGELRPPHYPTKLPAYNEVHDGRIIMSVRARLRRLAAAGRLKEALRIASILLPREDPQGFY